MSLSEPWTNSTPASTTRKNKTSVITVSGNDAASLDKTKFKLVALNADGTAGDKDDLLMVNATEDSFINLRDTGTCSYKFLYWWYSIRYICME